MIAIFSTVAPDDAKPVDVLTKSTPASLQSLQAFSSSDSERYAVSRITFNNFWRLCVSELHFAISILVQGRLVLNALIFQTTSISSAPLSIARCISSNLVSVILYPNGKPATVTKIIFSFPISRLALFTQNGGTQTPRKFN